MSCHVTSRHVKLRHVISYHAKLHNIPSSHLMPYTISHHRIPCHFKLHPIISCQIVSRHDMSCHITPHHTIPSNITSYHFTSRNTSPHHTTSHHTSHNLLLLLLRWHAHTDMRNLMSAPWETLDGRSWQNSRMASACVLLFYANRWRWSSRKKSGRGNYERLKKTEIAEISST